MLLLSSYAQFLHIVNQIVHLFRLNSHFEQWMKDVCLRWWLRKLSGFLVDVLVVLPFGNVRLWWVVEFEEQVDGLAFLRVHDRGALLFHDFSFIDEIHVDGWWFSDSFQQIDYLPIQIMLIHNEKHHPPPIVPSLIVLKEIPLPALPTPVTFISPNNLIITSALLTYPSVSTLIFRFSQHPLSLLPDRDSTKVSVPP